METAQQNIKLIALPLFYKDAFPKHLKLKGSKYWPNGADL